MKKRADTAPSQASEIWFYIPLGILPVAMGGLWILYIYAWASMVNPALVGWTRHKLIFSKMMPGALPGLFLVLAGIAFSTICVASVVFPSVRLSRVAIAVSIPLLLTCVLLVGLMWAMG